MLKRSGPFNKKQLVDAARDYCDLYDGKVPYEDLDLKKVCYVVFTKIGVYWKFKEIVK